VLKTKQKQRFDFGLEEAKTNWYLQFYKYLSNYFMALEPIQWNANASFKFFAYLLFAFTDH
jgi:hypothetical protein